METDTEFLELLCNRFILAQEATGLKKYQFADAVGLTGPQLTNIARYRNPPGHDAIRRAIREFGFTADWFYQGQRAGMRDERLVKKLRDAEAKLGLRA